MKDAIVLITGANSGIGKAAALKFAAEGYRVVMACRNIAAAEAAREQIAAVANRPRVDLMEVDMASFASIRAFCEAYKARYAKLDMLIHNAACMNHGEKAYRLGPDRIELTFATNAFGPFLMTNLLADCLEKSQDPRVLNACTTNIKHFFNPKRQIEFDNLQGELRGSRSYNAYKMYGDSKMALLMLTFKLAETLGSRGIKVNALQINRVKLSPETIRKMRSYWKLLAWIQNLTNPPPAGMAANYYRICTSDAFKDATGRLLNHKREWVEPAASEKGFAQFRNIFGSRSYPRYAADPANVQRIWDLSMALTQRPPVAADTER